MSAVLLQLLIDRFGTVWVDNIHYSIGDQSQVFGCQLLGVFDQLLLCSRHSNGIQVGPVEFLHGPCHHLHLLSAHQASALRRSQMRQHRPTASPSVETRRASAAAARIRAAASAGESCSLRVNSICRLEKQYSPARSHVSASAIKAWSMIGSRFRLDSKRCQKLIFPAVLRCANPPASTVLINPSSAASKVSRATSSGERSVRSPTAGSPSSMYELYSKTRSMTSCLLNKTGKILQSRPAQFVLGLHSLQPMQSCRNLRALRFRPSSTSRSLADLQLPAYRNQMSVHLFPRRLGITAAEHRQQLPVRLNSGPG